MKGNEIYKARNLSAHDNHGMLAVSLGSGATNLNYGAVAQLRDTLTAWLDAEDAK